MDQDPKETRKTAAKLSLDDQVVKYDMQAMLADAQEEFDACLSSRELIDQESIGKFFNLKGEDDARN